MSITVDLQAANARLRRTRGIHVGLMGRLIRSEFRKMTTTKAWLVFALAATLGTILSLMYNMVQATSDLAQIDPTWIASQKYEQVSIAASDLFTSGEYLGALMATLLAILLVTNEYQHKTVTTTFLATPNRTAVVVAKAVVAFVGAALFWFLTTAVDLICGYFFLHNKGLPDHLDDPSVVRTIFASLAVFGLWALFGLGIGALLRSQIWAAVIATLLYTVGYAISWILFDMISESWFHTDKADGWAVIVPALAAQVAVSPDAVFPHAPPAWVGLIIMLGYGITMTVAGIWIIRRRDIS